ncbi:hypothetical protein MTBSS4_580008 [Magnetospirillum sp. SS-4]|nr:hypothetical protein MTBSS4_580008 [Magnetospirillum sp. SS-4]
MRLVHSSDPHRSKQWKLPALILWGEFGFDYIQVRVEAQEQRIRITSADTDEAFRQ